MNYVDFNSNPAGFPLEADSTLGWMQGNIQAAIRGLASAFWQNGLLVPFVISGCEVTGSNMADGWVLHTDGEFYFFQGGTIQSTAIIETTTVSKSNEDGTLVPRYYTRKMKFGTGTGSFTFSPDNTFGNVGQLATSLNYAANGGNGWVIINGLNTISGGSGGITSGLALFGTKPVIASSYNSTVSSGSPRWLSKNGTWHATDPGGGLKFEPYSKFHQRSLMRKAQFGIGALIPWKSGVAELTNFFPGSGLGIGEWDGFALANGANGTLNLFAAISGVSWIQRIS